MYNITFTLKNDRVDKTWKFWYVSGLSAFNAKKRMALEAAAVQLVLKRWDKAQSTVVKRDGEKGSDP